MSLIHATFACNRKIVDLILKYYSPNVTIQIDLNYPGGQTEGKIYNFLKSEEFPKFFLSYIGNIKDICSAIMMHQRFIRLQSYVLLFLDL